MSGRKRKFLKDQTPRKLDDIISGIWINKDAKINTNAESQENASCFISTNNVSTSVPSFESACRNIFVECTENRAIIKPITNEENEQESDLVTNRKMNEELLSSNVSVGVSDVLKDRCSSKDIATNNCDSDVDNISPKTNSLNILSEQLSLLNNESALLVTPLHQHLTPGKRSFRSSSARSNPQKNTVDVVTSTPMVEDENEDEQDCLKIDLAKCKNNENNANCSTPRFNSANRTKRRLIENDNSKTVQNKSEKDYKSSNSSSKIKFDSVCDNDVSNNLTKTPSKGENKKAKQTCGMKTPVKGERRIFVKSPKLERKRKPKESFQHALNPGMGTDNDQNLNMFQDPDLDIILEKKAEEIKLTAKNVKSLLLVCNLLSLSSIFLII